MAPSTTTSPGAASSTVTKSFGGLPVEIADMTLARMSTPALGSISQTCRDLQKFAEPHLYESVSHSLQLFRTMCERPELAKLVQEYYYDVVNTNKNDIIPWSEDLAMCDKAALQAKELFPLVDLVPAANGTYWMERSREHICWLLSQFENLKALRTGRMMDISPLMIFWCPVLTNPTNMLQALRTIEIESEELGLFGYVNFEVGVFSLPELPCLQSLKFRSMGRGEVAGPLLWSTSIRIHPRWNSLTNLEIDWTPFLAADLEHLIIKSPQLTDLTWRIRIHHDQPNRYFDFGGLGAMLRQGKKLKRVDIRLDVQAEPSVSWAMSQIRWGPGGSAETGQTWGVTERIGSLKALRHLEELSIPLCALFGWEPPEDAGDVQWDDCLPASLRMLHLSQDLSDMKSYLWSNCWPTVRMCRALCAARLLGIAVEAPQRGDHRQCVRDGSWWRAIGLLLEN